MELNASIKDIPIPARLAHRPLSERGFPVPWFVSWINGKWDFVNLDPRLVVEACRRDVCFTCGQPLGRFKCFAIGPMCSINRVSSEPPSHRECALYAVRACPFLSRPNARRNTKAHLGTFDTTPGMPVEHNPGVTLAWITKTYHIMRVPNGFLFQIGEPTETLWFCEGRTATRAEILAAIDKGLPFLREAAAKEGDGAEEDLDRYIERGMKLVPAE